MEELREEPKLPENEGKGEGGASESEPVIESVPQPEQKPEQSGESSERLGELMAKLSANTAALKPAPVADLHNDVKSLAEVDEATRIERLLSLADTKGVTHAVKAALTLQDYYALDMMRDGLVERFHEKLEKELGGVK